MKRHEKQRGTDRRVTFALRLLRNGFSYEEAARRAYISEERLQRTLGTCHRKQLMEGETQMTEAHEHGTSLGTTGVPYGSEAMERLVATRMQALSASGRPADRTSVIRGLVNSGRIKTQGPGGGTRLSTPTVEV